MRHFAVQVRVIDATTTSCKSGETSLQWNQTGPAGPAGTSAAYIGRSGSASINNPGATLVTISLPAGSYALFGKANVQNLDGDGQHAECRLSTGEAGNAYLGALGAGGYRQVVVVQDLLNLSSPGTASLSCSTYDGTGFDGKLTAIKVGSTVG